jgi:integrase
VQPSGHKSWALKHAKVGKLTLATGTLEEARAWAHDMLAEIRKGRDPRVAQIKEREAAANTVAAVSREWIDKNKPFLRPITTEIREGMLRRHILPLLGHRPLGDITRGVVNDFIRALARKDKSVRDRRKPGGPKRVRKPKVRTAKPKDKLGVTTITNVAATLNTLAKWAIDEDIIGSFPLADVEKVIRKKPKPRDRYLQDHEIRELLLVLDSRYGNVPAAILERAAAAVSGIVAESGPLSRHNSGSPYRHRPHILSAIELMRAQIGRLGHEAPPPAAVRLWLRDNPQMWWGDGQLWPKGGHCNADTGYGDINIVALKTLLLSGQRRNEVTGMRWDELDLDAGIWVIPPERHKTRKRHVVPLSRQVIEIIRGVPRTSDVYVFSLDGKRPIRSLNYFQAEVARQLPGLASWSIHDLRKTVASGMARIGIDERIAERVEGRKVTGMSVASVSYQHHPHFDEKRTALQRWADHVMGLVEAPSSNVLELRKKA